jgi:hypothetical protein
VAPCAENRFELGSHAIRVNCAYYDLHEHANCRVNYLRRVTPSGLQYPRTWLPPPEERLKDPLSTIRKRAEAGYPKHNRYGAFFKVAAFSFVVSCPSGRFVQRRLE